MAVRKKTDVAENKVEATEADKPKVTVTTEYTVKDKYKCYSHVMVGSRLIPIVDGKIKSVNKEAVKEFIV